MQLNLRQAIIQRVHDKTNEELRDVVDDSVGNAEVTLPGLGVLFEIIWTGSTEEERLKMIGTLHDHLHNESTEAPAVSSPS
ncbi:small acid-soluble spore protein SspI [Cohnella faecalis]|uniref:Small, acid-soluble spore protein I n=1 Tax=Cohnella faecalis TaxID=2315694 RepID=A0A398CPN9_9BACL|nr:small acid-soluble spore protein SspI [Cohnella faecalis]RIE02698.1 small acid-soluble spore protein SspI [Cohnella faecalis]RIE02711.1 small acid-soluble spore protein SspI [Cohnella faecalis]